MTILEMFQLLQQRTCIKTINKLGAIRFAQKTGQKLTNFYSEDSATVNNNEKKTSGTLCIKKITDDIQRSLWSQPPSSTDKNIAGN